jgi:DNA-binding SARP family transcriptional activator/predicted ATPase
MPLEIALLGSLRVERDNLPLTGFRSDKERALLAMLALERQPIRRETLAGIFWGDQSQEQAYSNLRKTLHRLRATLEDRGGGAGGDEAQPLILATPKDLQLHPAAARLDVDDFTALIAHSRAHPHRSANHCTACRTWLAQAAALYRGDLLAGFTLPDAYPFDEWLVIRRETLRQDALAGLSRLAALAENAGDLALAEKTARQQIALEPWLESAHRQLMRIFAARGQRALALAQYDRLSRSLRTELDADPEAETTRLYRQIKTAGSIPPPTHAPRPLSQAALPPFIGRLPEIARLTSLLLDPATRLVSLVGPGGIGKSRLALAAAENAAPDFPDGAAFVPLAGLGGETDPAAIHNQIAAAIAAALGLAFRPGQEPASQLPIFLQHRQALLILDNFDTLTPHAAFVADLLNAAPGLAVLATSREPLRLQIEQVVRLDGLPVPPAADPAPESFDSVRLFIQRAAGSGAALTEAGLPAAVEICRFLEGTPLAIELAASWSPRLGAAQILETLRAGYAALEHAMRDVPPRHRSLHAVFEASWRALPAAEQAVLAGLSLFRGGFSGQVAAEVVPGAAAHLPALARKSLLREAGGRYELHELLRQFAADKLAESDADLDALRAAFCGSFAAHLQGRESSLGGAAPLELLAEMRLDLDNLRQAWQWMVAGSRLTDLARAARGFGAFLDNVGLYQEAAAAFQSALDAFPADESVAYARLLVQGGQFDADLGDFEKGTPKLQRAARVGEAAGAADVAALAYFYWGRAMLWSGEYAKCAELMGQAAEQARLAGLETTAADALRLMGIVSYYEGDFEESLRRYAAARDIYRAQGDARREGRAETNMALVYAHTGRFAAALEAHNRSIELSRASQDLKDEAIALNNYALLLRDLGRNEEALDTVLRGVEMFLALGDRQKAAHMLSNASFLASRMGDLAGAFAWAEHGLGLAEGEASIGQLLIVLGHAHIAANQPGEAEAAYQRALQLREATGVDWQLMDPLAGLARAALLRGDHRRAMEHVEKILAHLETGSIDAVDDSFNIHVVCVDALRAAGDARWRDALARAVAQLNERAAQILEPELREGFLHNVPSHRKLLGQEAESRRREAGSGKREAGGIGASKT